LLCYGGFGSIEPNGQDEPGTLSVDTARKKAFEEFMGLIEISNVTASGLRQEERTMPRAGSATATAAA
jgi:hypothetical protein